MRREDVRLVCVGAMSLYVRGAPLRILPSPRILLATNCECLMVTRVKVIKRHLPVDFLSKRKP